MIEIGPNRRDIVDQYSALIFQRQSEQPVKKQLDSFASENGFSLTVVDTIWFNTKHEMEETMFEERHTLSCISTMLNEIFEKA